jgi:hypothetical protein
MLRLTITTRAFVAVLLPACLAASPGARSCQANTTYSGEAFGASVSVLGIINTTISDTGPLPANGGSLSTQLAGIDLPALLNLGLLTESTTAAAALRSPHSARLRPWPALSR